MFWEKPVLINFSKIYQKTPAGKSFLGEVEAYRIFSNGRRASNGGSRLWLSGGAWAGLRVGLRSVAGGVVLALVWDGALRVFGVFFGGGGGVLVFVCVVEGGLGDGLSFYGAWTLSCGAWTLP